MANNGRRPCTPALCLVPTCRKDLSDESQSPARGMCGGSSQDARRLVRTNRTSWEELEQLGLADPPLRKHSPRTTKVEEALKNAKLSVSRSWSRVLTGFGDGI